jgi:hypothetical protein
MRVPVYETGKNERAPGIDGLLRLNAFGKKETVTERVNRVPVDGNLAMLDNPAVAIHRHDRGIRDQQVDTYGLFSDVLRKTSDGLNKK